MRKSTVSHEFLTIQIVESEIGREAFCWVWWSTPLIPALLEAETGGLMLGLQRKLQDSQGYV